MGWKMKHATYQVEVWKQGALVCRTEVSDCLEKTKRAAQTMFDALGATFTVFVLRNDVQFCSYEWDQLTDDTKPAITVHEYKGVRIAERSDARKGQQFQVLDPQGYHFRYHYTLDAAKTCVDRVEKWGW